jgi:biopolymer transport protein ExbD
MEPWDVRDKFERDKEGEVNLIPLLDTIFILLIFFSLLLIQASDSRILRIDLPAAQSGVSVEGEEIRFTITKEGLIFRGSAEKLSEKEITRLIRSRFDSPVVVIAADKETAFQHIVSLMDLLESEGCTQVALEVSPR